MKILPHTSETNRHLPETQEEENLPMISQPENSEPSPKPGPPAAPTWSGEQRWRKNGKDWLLDIPTVESFEAATWEKDLFNRVDVELERVGEKRIQTTEEARCVLLNIRANKNRDLKSLAAIIVSMVIMGISLVVNKGDEVDLSLIVVVSAVIVILAYFSNQWVPEREDLPAEYAKEVFKLRTKDQS